MASLSDDANTQDDPNLQTLPSIWPKSTVLCKLALQRHSKWSEQQISDWASTADIEKEKIQAQLVKEASEGALKNRDLDLKEQKLRLTHIKWEQRESESR